MTPDLMRKAEDVLFRALDAPKAHRARVVRELCAGDEALQREVESLLAHDAGATHFLTTPVLGTDLTNLGFGVEETGEDLSGEMVGPYRLERRAAVGGMGAVYAASRADGQFSQHVAIKLVKRGMDSDEILSRFRHERETLAALNHPNIARLLDGGVTSAGRPYLVMEFVEGRAIDEYCRERRLRVEQRLKLFRDVAEAVRYAHQNLVVHRDLKPSNVLVTRDGVVKLLDFGIAKVMSDSSATHTRREERRLTPEYASPEQVRGESVSTATDVYSLGVILYELLSGSRPYRFETRSSRELERVVCTQVPELPSVAAARGDPAMLVEDDPDARGRAASKRLRGDLDTIIMMALRKEPERRYASIEALLADIDRFSRGLPVSARRDTIIYRTSKFVRRHALACAAAAAILALGVAGVATIWRERDEAYSARDQSERINAYMMEFLRSPDITSADPEARADVRVRDVLASASARAEVEFAKTDPLVLAAVRSSVGRSYLALGMNDEARDAIWSAADIRKKTVGEGHHDFAESLIDMAAWCFENHDLTNAHDLLRSSLRIHERLRGTHNEDTARCWNDLGAVFRAQGQHAQAIEAHERAMKIRTGLFGPESLPVAESLNNIAVARLNLGDTTRAREAFEKALAIRQAAFRGTKQVHPLVLASMQNLAASLLHQQEYDGAETLYRQALPQARQAYGESHPAYARHLSNLALLLLETGREKEAEQLLREALAIFRDRVRLPDSTRPVQVTWIYLIKSLIMQGNFQETERELSAFASATGRTLSTAPGVREEMLDVIAGLEAEGKTDLAAKYADLGNSPAAAADRK